MSVRSDQLNRLPAETFVRAVEWHEEIGSTNDRAIAAAVAMKQTLPLLVVAGRQTAGRGRGGNRWWGAPGALMFSLALEGAALKLSTDRWPQVSLATALVVGDVIRQLVPAADVQLKWPNDVYVAGRKACGILLEAPAAAPGRIILGIGLNVNNSVSAAPPELRDTAVALCDIAGKELDLFDALLGVLHGLEDDLSRLAAGHLNLTERWQPYCLLEGRTVTIQQGREEITGRCDSIDANGGLLLHTTSGQKSVISGTVVSYE